MLCRCLFEAVEYGGEVMFKVKLKKAVGPIYEVYAVQNDLNGKIRFLIYQPPGITGTESWAWRVASDFEPVQEEPYTPPSSPPWWWNYSWWEVNPAWNKSNTITTDNPTPIYDIHVGDISANPTTGTVSNHPPIQNPCVTTATSSN